MSASSALEIVEAARHALGIEHDGRRHHRARQRTAADLVDADYRPHAAPTQASLAIEAWPRRQIEKEQIGFSARHAGSLPALASITRPQSGGTTCPCSFSGKGSRQLGNKPSPPLELVFACGPRLCLAMQVLGRYLAQRASKPCSGLATRATTNLPLAARIQARSPFFLGHMSLTLLRTNSAALSRQPAWRRDLAGASCWSC